MRVMEKEKLLGMTLDELKAVATEVGLPSFAAKQMAEWVYGKRVRSIDEMTNLSLKGRSALAERYEIGCMLPSDVQLSITSFVSSPLISKILVTVSSAPVSSLP